MHWQFADGRYDSNFWHFTATLDPSVEIIGKVTFIGKVTWGILRAVLFFGGEGWGLCAYWGRGCDEDVVLSGK